MQNCAAPRVDAAWRMRFSLKKCCTTCRPRPSPPKIAPCGHADVGEPDVGVVGRHVERPQELDDLEARACRSATRNAVMPSPSPALPLVRAKIRSYCARVDAGVPRLLAVDDPLVAVAHGVRLHVRGVGAVLGLGDAEREAAPAFGEVVEPLRLLLLGAVVEHQQQADVVADDRVLVLQVVVQPEALAGEVLADDRHAEVGAVLAAVLLRERVAVVAGGVGAAPRLARAAPPTPRSAGRRAPSRCGRPRGGGRRSGCCRPACSSGLISRSMKSSSSSR